MSTITEVKPQQIPLWPNGAPGTIDSGKKEEIVHRSEAKLDRAIHNICEPTLTVYLPPENKSMGTAVIVCPGGGFKYLAIDKEGHDVAKRLSTHGMAAFVLTYRTTPHERSVAFQDGRRALKVVRSRAEAWKIDPHRTGIIGFSAGGHIASATITDDDSADDPIDKIPSRPDFIALFYGCDKTKVTPQSPPTFIVHADDDAEGPVEKSIDYYQALRAAGVSTEMHIFDTGSHGFGLGIKEGNSSRWPDLFINWLRQLKMLGENK